MSTLEIDRAVESTSEAEPGTDGWGAERLLADVQARRAALTAAELEASRRATKLECRQVGRACAAHVAERH